MNNVNFAQPELKVGAIVKVPVHGKALIVDMGEIYCIVKTFKEGVDGERVRCYYHRAIRRWTERKDA